MENQGRKLVEGRGNWKLAPPPIPKKIFAQGKLNGKKSHARQLTLKNICFKSPKKIDTRKMLTPKNSCGSKIPHPPHNFSNGPLITKNTERIWTYCN